MRNILTILILLSSQMLMAQGICPTWTSPLDSIKVSRYKETYKINIESETYAEAIYFWEYLYNNAPGSYEGLYKDGIKLYKTLLQEETDASVKLQHQTKVLEIYDRRAECYPLKKGNILARKAYDMYKYELPFQDVYETFKLSVELEGNRTQSFVLSPYADVAHKMYESGRISSIEKIQIKKQLMAIADYNVKMNPDKGQSYNTASAYVRKYLDAQQTIHIATTPTTKPSNTMPNDCEYYIGKYQAKVDGDPGNKTLIEQSYSELKALGCTQAEDFRNTAMVRYEDGSASVLANSNIKAINPVEEANFAIRAGNYTQAIEYLKKAAMETTDLDQRASYDYKLAEIYFSKIDNKEKARYYALKAAQNNQYTGKAYLLIGDMYVASTKTCYESSVFNQRMILLAAIDKWKTAQEVDPSLRDKANERIRKYKPYLPTKSEIFMNKEVKEGKTFKIGCWIQEKVKVRGR